MDSVRVEVAGNGSRRSAKKRDMLYTVGESPPWYLCLLLGFQVHHLVTVLTEEIHIYSKIIIDFF